MSKFSKSKVALGVSLAMGAFASVGSAQEQTASSQNEEVVLEEITVVGIRGSLQRAQEKKMNSASVIEALSSEDIGKLPDTSIAESLARLSGLAGERRNGRTSGISVRGFREDFVGTTLNGRELIGIGDNRGVEYDLYPAEIISGAEVYKTSDTSLTAQGVGGTVNLQTVKPLSVDPGMTLNVSYEQNGSDAVNSDFDDQGHRIAFSMTEKFANDTIGLALTYANTDSPTQAQFVSTRPFGGYTTGNILSGPNAGVFSPNGIYVRALSRSLERETIAGIFEFSPNDSLTATVDYLTIDFEERGLSRSLWDALPIATDGSGINAIDGNVVTSATTTGFNSVIRHEPFNKIGSLDVYGLNLAFEVSDSTRINFDVARSESTKFDQRAESYAGIGRPGLPVRGQPSVYTYTASDNVLTFDDQNDVPYDDYDLIRLTGPQNWGSNLASVERFQESQTGVPGVGFAQAQDGFDNTGVFDEELTSARFDLEKDFEGEFFKNIHIGVNYRDQSKTKSNQGFYLTAETFPFDGPIPESFRRGTVDLSFAGLGNIVAYDAQGLLDSGFYIRTPAALLETDRLGDTYTVEETVISPFIKLGFEKTYETGSFYGNVGLRADYTDQKATGFNTVVGSDFTVIATPIEGGDEYTKVLPSINLNYDFGNGHIVRAAAAKVISRPRIDNLGKGFSIRFDNAIGFVSGTTPADGPWKSSSGNSELRPFEANQFDLSYEWYFSDFGYLSASYYYKDLVNWTRASTEVIDYSQFYIPGFHQAVDIDGTIVTPGTFQGINTFVEDGLTGKVDGLEFQLNLSLGEFLESLDGFGLSLGAAFSDGYLDGEGLRSDSANRIPGLSDEVFQITAFYEKGGFEFRIAATDRSDFLTEIRGGSNSLSPSVRSDATLVDAQISYDFSYSNIDALDGLRISLQAQNLTDEDDINVDRNGSGAIDEVERFGRNFLLTARYSF